MQPTLCSRCKKNVAVIFITRIENGESHNEGLCLRCARELHIKPVDEMMEKLGISDADLDNLTGDVAEMLGSMGMLGGDGAADADSDAADDDTDEDDGKTATFPFLNRLFNQNPPPAQDAAAAAEPPRADGAADKRGAAPRKLKFLNNYCIDLTAARARRQARRHGRPRPRSSSASSRSSTAARRTTPASSASPASARRPSPRDLPSASPRGTCPISCATRRSICSTSRRLLRARSSAASSRAA